MTLDIHKEIKDKLNYFHSVHKVPNIMFNGTSGSGKSQLVKDFIATIYDDNKDKIKEFVMHVNCGHGKGIKFIRDELKFFAKTHIDSNGGNVFKSIVLYNADKLTMDAQSALRRCIELFNHNTRFFILVEDKYKLLKPILSRLCEIYIPEPTYKSKVINLHKYNVNNVLKIHSIKNQRNEWLKKILIKELSQNAHEQTPENKTYLFNIATKLYEKGYSGLDIIYIVENGHITLEPKRKYELLIAFNKVRKELRNEKLLIAFMLNFIYYSPDYKLDNITFM
jgi:DNA polymerase III delta prime subunit